ncbi:MAG TPA: DUF480 domain-containing protein [Gemmatales bacterium]|nr:DUF480 domain-containing protein [Gemmatales bacterium]
MSEPGFHLSTPEPTPTAPGAPPAGSPSWPDLSLQARRVLGALIEKGKTTPDNYPLTLNGLVAGCNQKSNRDPVLELVDAEVEVAVDELKRLGYTEQVMGSGRTDKFRHVLYNALRVEKGDLAILAELLLRGPQTEGELRTRCNRMDPFPDLETLRARLRSLEERGLVFFIESSHRRAQVVMHGFCSPGERLGAGGARSEAVRPRDIDAPRSSGLGDLAERVSRLEAEVRELREALLRVQETR